jgi:predicted AAA+ superfamily ATPase
MVEEKAIRTGTAIDDQFSQFVTPEEAVITVTVQSSIRQVGKFRLAALLEKFLKEQGFANIQIDESIGINFLDSPMENEELIEKQKKVQIQIEVK